jgi:hypothetical protein
MCGPATRSRRAPRCRRRAAAGRPGGDRTAQQLLAGTGVLVRVEPAVDDQPAVVIDDQEQPAPDRPLPPGPRHPGTDEDVGDPPLVRRGGLVAAVRLRLGRQRLAVQPGPAQLPAHGPLGHLDPVPVIQDRGDLRRRPAGQLQPQRRRLGEQLRMCPHDPGVGPPGRLERVQASGPPGPQPPVDRAPRVRPRRATRVRVRPRRDPPDQRPALPRGQPAVRGLGDHRPAVQRDLLLQLVIHPSASLMPVMAGREA